MKKILIMRHAKTEVQEIFRSDFVRNLTISGMDEAHRQGQFLSLLPFKPNLILVSPSNRTMQTLENLLPSSLWENFEIKIQDNLYHAGLAKILEIIAQVDNGVDELMLIGHNFGVMDLVAHLSNQILEKFKPSSLSLFELNIESWQNLSSENASLKYLKGPNDE